MGAGEHEAEAFVGDLQGVFRSGCVLGLQEGHHGRRFLGGVAAAVGVEPFPACHSQEPRLGRAGDARGWPVHERRRERLGQCVLGARDVTGGAASQASSLP